MGRSMDAGAEAPANDIPQLAQLAGAIGRQANAAAVFGSPIVDGERTIIPVAEARLGLGAGDGFIAKGVGGAMTAKPMGLIVIDKQGVRFHRTPRPSLAPLALGVVLGLAIAIRLMRPPRARPTG